MQKLGICIVGAGGNIAQRHAFAYQQIRDRVRLVSVVSRSETTAKRKKDEWGVESWSTNCEKVLRDEAVDAVDLCVPPFVHARLAVAAAEEGKHVLVEKPMATNLEDADRMISATRKAKTTLMVAESVRFVPAHQRVKTMLQEEAIGRVMLGRSLQGGYQALKRMLDPKSWKGRIEAGGGGVLMEAGIHRLDLYKWLLGDVDYVYSWAENLEARVKGKGEDNALVFLRFKDGATGELINSWTIRTPWVERLELYGTSGSIFVDLSLSQPLALFSGRGSSGKGWFYPSVQHSSGWPGWMQDSISREILHFVDSVVTGQEPMVTGEDGRAALELVLAAYASAKDGRTVKLPLRSIDQVPRGEE